MTNLDLFGVAIISTDLELKPVANTCVINFSARTLERVKSADGTTPSTVAHFFHFEIWDTAAKYLSENAKKGDRIIILSATPREHRWEKNGVNHSKVVFRINKFQIIPYTVVPKEENEST